MEAVKLEGAGATIPMRRCSLELTCRYSIDAARLRTVETLVNGGIAVRDCLCDSLGNIKKVMGHIGLTPQSYSTLGGFRAQGKHAQQVIGK